MKNAGTISLGGILVALLAVVPATSAAAELSEKSVRTFMSYAWTLMPERFTPPNGKTILVDKSKRDAVIVPIETAREVIRVGRMSAHAQICNLPVDQQANYRSLMKREQLKGTWTPQQMLYISQLHLTTVQLLTSRIKVSIGEGDKKEVVVIGDEEKGKSKTCTDEERSKVKDVIAAYVKAGPKLAGAGGAATGSVKVQPTAEE